MAWPPETSYWGVSHARRFGSFQTDHAFTVGYLAPRARTKSPNSFAFGLQVLRAFTDPLQPEAQAGIGPVGVRTTFMPRACAPATKESSIPNTPGAYCAGFLPSNPFGFFVAVGDGA